MLKNKFMDVDYNMLFQSYVDYKYVVDDHQLPIRITLTTLVRT
jgi:hypothetical protein